ncbi:hypothetical protein QTP88_008873 [Uroleucon formosanum]
MATFATGSCNSDQNNVSVEWTGEKEEKKAHKTKNNIAKTKTGSYNSYVLLAQHDIRSGSHRRFVPCYYYTIIGTYLRCVIQRDGEDGGGGGENNTLIYYTRRRRPAAKSVPFYFGKLSADRRRRHHRNDRHHDTAAVGWMRKILFTRRDANLLSNKIMELNAFVEFINVFIVYNL